MNDDFDLTNIPPPETKRWVVRRKAAVIQAVRDGSISLQDACRRYTLSIEEFLAWGARGGPIWHSGAARYTNTDLPRYRRSASGEREPCRVALPGMAAS